GGGWSATITIPASASGSHIIGASGPTTTPAVTRLFTVTPAIAINRSGGAPGSSVTVNGAGFAANEMGITVTYDGAQVVSGISANAQGGWSTTMSVPSSTSGYHIIDAFGTATSASAVPDLSFTVTASISISRTSGPPGSSATITGSSFGANETGITVTYDGTAVSSGLSANSQGNWSTTLAIPASASGSHTIDVYGNTTSASSISDLSFTVTPSIAVNRTGGAPGTSVTVTGSGFAANETGITVTYDGSQVGSSVSANPQGGWSTTFSVPTSAAGSHTIDASGSTTPSTTVPDLGFGVTPTITINRTTGVAGTSVTVTGSSFGVNETGISVTYDGTPIGSGISANFQGAWTATVVVPASASGSHNIDAQGILTSASSVPDVAFTVAPSISLGRTSGTPGITINVTGSSFSAGETGITVTYEGSAVASGITASPQGGWTTAVVVPPSAGGSHTVDAYGSTTSASAVPDAVFTITSIMSVNPALGNVGSTVQVSGSGFGTKSPVRFLYDDREIATEGVTTDASGSFSKSITIPKSKAGAHTVKAVVGQSESEATFTMESTPPAIPRPLSPEDSARVGFLGGATPTFKWSSVTDPSGVTFVLQLDKTPDFVQQPILEKRDLLGASCTLTAAEALPFGQYYWRMKAIDGASNESEWTQPQLLKSGLMSISTLVVVIMAALAAAALLYFLLARTRARRREAVGIPEPGIPQTVTGQWRLVDEEETAPKRRALPLRLSLPQPAKQAKTLNTEQVARLKVIADFAQSLPLAEPCYTADWLTDLLESSAGSESSATVQKQLLKGDLQANYEPAWMRHPTYQEMLYLLQGQPILGELQAFIDGVSRSASEASSLLRDIYHEASAGMPQNVQDESAWAFVGAVYSDAISWFLGKSLRDPSERDYAVARGGSTDERPAEFWLHGGDATCFAGPIAHASSEEEALKLRALHLKLRRTYRASDRARSIVAALAQLDVQRSKLLSVFSQFGNFGVKGS
ncbi:MAG: IPT/TIG domain-containing protein, partial [Chloroflexota bacterium]